MPGHRVTIAEKSSAFNGCFHSRPRRFLIVAGGCLTSFGRFNRVQDDIYGVSSFKYGWFFC